MTQVKLLVSAGYRHCQRSPVFVPSVPPFESIVGPLYARIFHYISCIDHTQRLYPTREYCWNSEIQCSGLKWVSKQYKYSYRVTLMMTVACPAVPYLQVIISVWFSNEFPNFRGYQHMTNIKLFALVVQCKKKSYANSIFIGNLFIKEQIRKSKIICIMW